jgi:hypothetical protein
MNILKLAEEIHGNQRNSPRWLIPCDFNDDDDRIIIVIINLDGTVVVF